MVKKHILKLISIFSLLTLILSCLSIQTFAKEESKIGRIYLYKPYVNIELYDFSGKSSELNSVILGDEALKINRASAYNKNKDKSLVYLLVDLSTSINQTNFNKLKTALLDFVDDMPEQDEMVLITFGAKIDTLLSGKESKQERKNVISSLRANQNRTAFYEALKEAYNQSLVANDKFDRRYMIVVSDGIDVQKGNATKNEISNLYKTHALPFFALCDDANNSSSVNELGQLARSSGGNVYLYNSSTAKSAVDDIKSTLDNSYIIKAESSSNKADGKTQKLSVNFKNKQFTQNVDVMNSTSDNDCPVADISFDKSEPKCFYIEFSEKVLNADNASEYSVMRNGKECKVESVEKTDEENKYKLTLKNYVKNADYTFEFGKITDESVERNSAENAHLNSVKTNYFVVVIIYAIAAILIALAVAFIIFLINKKRKEKAASYGEFNSEAEEINYIQENANSEVKHKVIFNEKPSIEIVLELSRTGASPQTITAKLYESLFVGRADICDICIDDKRMSRQHFVLQNDNGKIIISDLNTTNGTFVNSIRLSGPIILNQGDEIVAGTCRMKFYAGGFSD